MMANLVKIEDAKGEIIWLNKDKIIWITKSRTSKGITDILMEDGSKVFVSGDPTEIVNKYIGRT